jgi:hypothetical protein
MSSLSDATIWNVAYRHQLHGAMGVGRVHFGRMFFDSVTLWSRRL